MTEYVPPPHDQASRPRGHAKRILFSILLLVLIGGSVWYFYPSLFSEGQKSQGESDQAQQQSAPGQGQQGSGGHKHAGGGSGAGGKNGSDTGPIPVTVATIQKGDIDVTRRALGTVTPLANVTVHTQIDGILMEVGFQEGQMVNKGDFLAQIDPRPYQISLEQAQGALERDQALLKEAKLDLDRYQKLWSQNSIAKQTLDAQASLVQQDEGNVQTDQSQIDSAQLNLTYAHITAPVGGRVGLRQVDPGNYVQTSDANGIVIITQLKPITTIFTLPEDDVPAVMKPYNAGTVLTATAYDRAQSTKLATGTLTAVDNQINTSTGTFNLRAQFDNQDNSLFPNQFVNVELKLYTEHDAVLAPVAAVQRGTPGTFVYKLKDDNTVAVQTVKLGVTQGDNVAITDGLAVGDKVVTEGVDKLRDGARVSVK